MKYYREKAGLMEYELADKSGIAEKTVHRIEEGLTKDVSLSIVLRLAKVFKLKATYLSDFLRKARFVPDDSPAGRSLEFIMFYFDRFRLKIRRCVFWVFCVRVSPVPADLRECDDAVVVQVDE